MITVEERFDAKWTPEPNTGCWLWTRALDTKGYGRFYLWPMNRRAHRVAYERWVGPIPDGLQIDHLCRVRSCVNPAHLEPVTQRENLVRGNTIVAANVLKTHCKRGHPFDETNTYRNQKGWRWCRVCRAARMRAHRRGELL